jgi:hypothetical protein
MPAPEHRPLLRVYLGLEALMASKETYRQQDQFDLMRLKALKELRDKGLGKNT